jgi:hypothetical protein
VEPLVHPGQQVPGGPDYGEAYLRPRKPFKGSSGNESSVANNSSVADQLSEAVLIPGVMNM